MAFAWDIQHYPTLASYRDALMPFAVPAWIRYGDRPGVTLHHTVVPTQATWRGRRTMEALGRYYRGLGWPAGPHLFLAPDGLYAGTPLAVPGVHAGACNQGSIGLEVVGNFDQQAWGPVLQARVYELTCLLLRWMRRDETSVRGHRECLSNKTCPGAAIAMGTVRTHIRNDLFAAERFRVAVLAARVRDRPDTAGGSLGTLARGATVPCHPVLGGAVEGSREWVRVRLSDGRIGYVWEGLGVRTAA